MGTNNTKQAAWVALGSIFSYCFTIISSMVLSRFFTKADYGTYQQVLYVYNTLLMVFTLGLPKAYSFFLPRVNNSQAKDVINKITILFFCLGAIFSLTIFFGSSLIARILNNAELTKALKIFSLVPFLMLPTMGVEGILATYKKAKYIAVYTALTRSIMLLCVILPVVVWGGGYREALIGFTVASICAFIIALYLKYMPVRSENKQESDVSYKSILQFSFPLLLASIWGILINSTDQIFISYYFGKETFAEFSNGAIELPFATLIISATSTVLIPLFSKQVSSGGDYEKEVLITWTSVFKKATMLIYPILIFCILDSTLIMSVLYGRAYEVSGNYFAIKVISNFVKVVPYASILIALGAVSYYSKLHMIMFLVLVPLEWMSVLLFKNPLVITIVHTLCVVMLGIFFIRYIAQKLKVSIKQIVPTNLILKLIIGSSVVFLITRLLTQLLFTGIDIKSDIFNLRMEIIMLFVDIVIYTILFLIFIRFFKVDYKSIIRPLLSKRN